MPEVYPLNKCEPPEVIVVQVMGIEGAQAPKIPVSPNPLRTYLDSKKEAEDGAPVIIPPAEVQTLDTQLAELSNSVGVGVGTNVKDIRELKEQIQNVTGLATGASDVANEAKEISLQATEDAKAADVKATSATESADAANRKAESAIDVANKAKTTAESLGGIATTAKAGIVKPFTNHFQIAVDGELQINRQIFQYIQGLFDDCLKSVKQELSDDQKQQVMQNLGAQGMMISLGRKDLVESIEPMSEKKIVFNYTRRIKNPQLNKISINITRRSEWAEGDEEKVVLSYDGYTTDNATIVIRNKGSSPATVRFAVQATYEL